MRPSIERFLRYLEAERNCSGLTIKSYSEDLESFCFFFELEDGSVPSPKEFQPTDLREFISAMGEAGYARTSTVKGMIRVRVENYRVNFTLDFTGPVY